MPRTSKNFENLALHTRIALKKKKRACSGTFRNPSVDANGNITRAATCAKKRASAGRKTAPKKDRSGVWYQHTVQSLRNVAKSEGVKGYSKMNKQALMMTLGIGH